MRLPIKRTYNFDKETKWLVYDFGGGTFDVALLQIGEREMNVLDNEGDNFLGGMDIDHLIIEKLIAPKLASLLNEPKLLQKFKEPNNSYQKLYYELLFRAEEAKKELSIFESTEIEVDFPQKNLYCTIEITRSNFNEIIAPIVEDTITFCNNILKNNGLLNNDIEKIIMVGGSTLIPYVKNEVSKKLNIPIDTSVDPTSAVGLGAAYYAGNKPKTTLTTEQDTLGYTDLKNTDTSKNHFEIFYQKNSQDLEELIAVNTPENFKGFYRIIRKDGGYDTGLVKTNGAIDSFVDLIKEEINIFELKIFDENQNEIYQSSAITIHQGKYNIKGQLLPSDICLEIDDLEFNITRLEAIFLKNSVLPVKKTLYKSASKTVVKGSNETIQINIVEGDDRGLPSSGLSIGFIEISGTELTEDLIKGTDIELEIAISESRDINIGVYLNACDQEFSNTFTPTERYISSSKMNNEMKIVVDSLDEALRKKDQTNTPKLQMLREQLIELQIQLSHLAEDDVTDAKFKIDNLKRTYIKEFDELTRHKDLNKDISEYHLELLRIKRTIEQ